MALVIAGVLKLSEALAKAAPAFDAAYQLIVVPDKGVAEIVAVLPKQTAAPLTTAGAEGIVLMEANTAAREVDTQPVAILLDAA